MNRIGKTQAPFDIFFNTRPQATESTAVLIPRLRGLRVGL